MTASAPVPLTRVEPGGPAALGDDPFLPFWAAVRRRHPQVALVLLPPPPDDERPDAIDTAQAQAVAVASVWRLLAELIEAPPSVRMRWRHASGRHRCTIQVALDALGGDRGTLLLRDAAHGLGGRGWLLAASTRRGVPLLRGVAPDGGIELRAEAGPGACIITLRGAPLLLAAADLGLLEEEAASWV